MPIASPEKKQELTSKIATPTDITFLVPFYYLWITWWGTRITYSGINS